MDSGREASEMDRENKAGPMELSILVNGRKTELMARDGLCMWMEMCMMDCGPMTKLMGTESISMLMEHNTKASGKMIYSTERVLKPGQMVLDMRATMHLEEIMGLVLTNGMMDHSTMESGLKTKYQDLEYTHGLMAESMKGNGKITIWRD
jgi:hypothetical protein